MTGYLTSPEGGDCRSGLTGKSRGPPAEVVGGDISGADLDGRVGG